MKRSPRAVSLGLGLAIVMIAGCGSKEAEMKPVRAKARAAWEKTKRVDRAQGFGKLLDEAETFFRNAEACVRAKKFEEAKAAYEKFLEQCKALDKLEGERREAVEAMLDAEWERRDAERKQAATDAKALWDEAEQLSKTAKGVFENARFVDATRTWRGAEAAYARALKSAVGARRVAAARDPYQRELDKCDAAMFAEYGRDVWGAVVEAVKEAEGAGDDFDKAVAAYGRAKELLPAADLDAREECKEHLLNKARANDSKENRNTALTALDKLLAIEPDHAEAKELREKIAAYTQTLIVPDEYPSIGKAINAARAGDTVRVKKGVYTETIKFNNGIKLVGDGMDDVTVRCDAKKDVVLFVDRRKSGLISGLTFEHTGSDPDDDRFPIILLRKSFVELFRCRVRHGVGAGVVVGDGGGPTIRECIVESNAWEGISVCGKGTRATLKNNLCSGNGFFGIYFDGGAGGLAEGNTCEKNSISGIFVRNKGTTATLRKNICRKNKQQGIDFAMGGGIAEENVCENNGNCDILVRGSAASPTLKNNRCKNSGNGIYFLRGASGLAEGNICENSKKSGICVKGPDTAPTFRNNVVRHSGNNGIWFGKGAGGVAQGNICEKNKGTGIAVTDKGTSPKLRDNVCKDNGDGDIKYLNGAQAPASEDDAEGNVDEDRKKHKQQEN